MQAWYGKASAPVNGAEVTSNLTVTAANSWGVPLRYMVAYNVLCYLTGSGQADLSKKELAFRAALLKPNQDFILRTDAGGVSSAAILNDQTASGTRVVSISTPESKGAEFVNRRTIAFTVTAEYHVKDTARAVVSWTETVSITGTGGPRRSWRFPINAKAIRQVVTPFSLVRAVQQGQAIGYLARPFAPRLLWPAYEVFDARQLSYGSAERFGDTFINFPVSWAYQYERGDGPLVGVPLLPPGVL